MFWLRNKKIIFLSPISCYLCCLLITFVNSLEPGQARYFVGPDLNLNCLTLLMHFLKEFFPKDDFEKNQQTTKEASKLPSMQRFKELVSTTAQTID